MLSPDGAMWKIVHYITKADGEKVGTITIEGSWFNWEKRQAVAPAQDLVEVMTRFEHTGDFQ
jgi:hypothetical protein